MKESSAPQGYRSTDPYVVCQRSGWKVRLSETVREWTGARVLKRLAEPKHPSLDPRTPRGEEVIDDPTGKPVDIDIS